MPSIKTFPMQNGPPIPYALAELILEAHVRCGHGMTENTLAAISDRGGFGWQEVPLIFGNLRKKDKILYEDLMQRARKLPAHDTSKVVTEQAVQVHQAIMGAEVVDATLRPEDPNAVDWWKIHDEERQAKIASGELPPPSPVKAADAPPLTIVCWKWNSADYRIKFEHSHVNTLARMIKRNYTRPHRLVCITDDPRGITECETFKLWKDHSQMANVSGKHLPSCYRRLRLFSKEVAAELGSTRLMSIDLDVILTGNVDHIFDRADPFIGWKVPGVYVDWVYNGSMWMFDVGPYEWIWSTFDPNRSPILARNAGYQGSDQGWISYCLRAREPGWSRHDGVYSYPREIRHAMGLPQGARMVIFHGQRKPWDKRHTRDKNWIGKHYR